MRFRWRCYPFKLIIQWIPGHKDVPGNDLADEVAKEAAENQIEHNTPTWFHASRARLKALYKDPQPVHIRTKKVYAAYSKQKEEDIKTRRDQTLLAKIRSGHTILFKAYHHRIDESVDPMCPLCNQDEHTLTHWMCDCAGTERKRYELLGPEDYDKLESMTRFPTEVVALARETLLPEEP